MRKRIEKKENAEHQDFISEYNNLFMGSYNSVIIRTEWTKAGDFFQKLSMYDDSYSSVKTLGSTTLRKAI